MMAATLTNCVPYGGSPSGINLPPPPSDLSACFARLVPMPAAGVITRKDIVALVAALRASEAAKSACGKRLLAWYDAEAAGLRGAK